jgi:hypothetical protein
MKRLRSKLTYANVVSTLCLFLLVGGGAAFATTQLPKNSVGTKQLKEKSVGNKQLKPNSVTGDKVKDGSLNASDLSAGTIPPKVDAYTKTESDSRFSTQTETANHAYAKAESDGRYLRGTITVVGSIPVVAPNSFESGSVSCPAGYQAIGGGVDPFNVFFAKVSQSAPTYNGERALFQSVGQHGPANGWEGTISTEGAGTGSAGTSRVVVICSPIG